MTDFKSKLKISVLIFSIFYFLFFVFHSGHTQTTSQFLVSWQAQNYAPAWYQGKIFPTKGTPMNISFELIDKNKIVDVSKYRVRWYVNDQLIKNEDNGLGIKSVGVTIPDYPGNATQIRISLPDYSNGLDKIITIPVIKPDLVIDSPYYNNQVLSGQTSSFYAYPFFFNVKTPDALSFEWLVNGQPSETPSAEPAKLDLKVEAAATSGFQINIQAIAGNVSNQLESASKNITVEIK